MVSFLGSYWLFEFYVETWIMCARLAPWDLDRTTSLRPLSSVGTADARCQEGANSARIRCVGLTGAETLGEFFTRCAASPIPRTTSSPLVVSVLHRF